MIDIYCFYAMFETIFAFYENPHIIISEDVHQLSFYGPGAVFSDMMNSNQLMVINLTSLLWNW